MNDDLRDTLNSLYFQYLLSKGEDGGNCPEFVSSVQTAALQDPTMLDALRLAGIAAIAQKVWHNDPSPADEEKRKLLKTARSRQGKTRSELNLGPVGDTSANLKFWPETAGGVKLKHRYTTPDPTAPGEFTRTLVLAATVRHALADAQVHTQKAHELVAAAEQDTNDAARLLALAGGVFDTKLAAICDQAQPDAA